MAAPGGRYDYQEITDRPLFGEATPRDRVLNIIVGGLTGLFVLITLVESFVVRSVRKNQIRSVTMSALTRFSLL